MRAYKMYMVNWRRKFGATSFSTKQSKVRGFWKILSGKQQDQTIRNLTDPVDNKLYSDKIGLTRIMVNHYRKLFNPGEIDAEPVSYPSINDPEVGKRIKEAFRLENIVKCKSHLRSGSAPGHDSISYDMLKLTGSAFDAQINVLFNRIMTEQKWPKHFQVSLLKSLYKSGRRDLMVNYR